MRVTALIMAGGKGTRMGGSREKALLSLEGKTMLEHVVHALQRATAVERIVVAASRHTVRTAEVARKLGVEVVETPGAGYIQDMKYVIRTVKLMHTLVLSADLPLINGNLIDEIVEKFHESGKPALTVMVLSSAFAKLGILPSYKIKVGGRYLSPSAINLLDGSMIDESELDEQLLVLKQAERLINVNTHRDLLIAKKLMQRTGRHFSKLVEDT